MNDLLNKPVSIAYDYLGYPDDMMELGLMRIYEWNYEHSYTYIKTSKKSEPVYKYVSLDRLGFVQNKVQVDTKIVETKTPVQVNDYSVLRLIIDEDDIITNYEIDGTDSGIEYFTDKLIKYCNDLKGMSHWHQLNKLPEVIYEPDLIVPNEYMYDNISDSLIVQFRVDQEGATKEISITKSTNNDLNNIALEVIKNTKYKPALVNGRATGWNLERQFNF